MEWHKHHPWHCPAEYKYSHRCCRQPVSYSALTLPSGKQVLIMTALALGLGAIYILIVGLFVPPANELTALVYTLGTMGVLPAVVLLMEPKQTPRRLLGEFRFQPWNIAPHASVRSVTRLTMNDSALANQADRLAGHLMPGDYLAQVELATSWARDATSYVTYIKVDKLFAEAFYNGMSVNVRYQVSRLHPSRLRIKSAL